MSDRREHWSDGAACKGLDTNLFFDDEGRHGQAPKEIVRTCYDCPVKYECRLAGYAEQSGYWGNSAPKDRNRSRIAIFGRVFGTLTRVVDDNLDGFRVKINAVLSKEGTVAERLAASGLNDREIQMFFKYTAMDERGHRFAEHHRQWTTDRLWGYSANPKRAQVEEIA